LKSADFSSVLLHFPSNPEGALVYLAADIDPFNEPGSRSPLKMTAEFEVLNIPHQRLKRFRADVDKSFVISCLKVDI